MTDAALVERARQGDTAAFGLLVDRHRAAAYRAALAVLASPAEAEDAAQDACVDAFSKLAQFRGEASFRTWLMRITWRRAITQRRRLRWSLRWARLDENGAPDPPAPGATPERGVLDAELRRTVRRVVGGLPAKFREPLLLAASGEHAYAEIAQVMGLPEGTVKWRVSEARRLLRQRLQRLGLDHA